ncbi:MAG: hypothetical protein D6E12_08860, partial [Desulfovibrio sp.]
MAFTDECGTSDTTTIYQKPNHERGLMRTILLCCVVALCVLATTFPLAAQEVGDEWVEPITGMEFVWVPGGCYEMGCG